MNKTHVKPITEQKRNKLQLMNSVAIVCLGLAQICVTLVQIDMRGRQQVLARRVQSCTGNHTNWTVIELTNSTPFRMTVPLRPPFGLELEGTSQGPTGPPVLQEEHGQGGTYEKPRERGNL